MDGVRNFCFFVNENILFQETVFVVDKRGANSPVKASDNQRAMYRKYQWNL